MTTSPDWIHVTDLGFYVEPEGTEIGEDVVQEGNLALVVGPPTLTVGYATIVIEGTQEELVAFASAVLTVLESYDPDAPDEDEELEPRHRMQTVEVTGEVL